MTNYERKLAEQREREQTRHTDSCSYRGKNKHFVRDMRKAKRIIW